MRDFGHCDSFYKTFVVLNILFPIINYKFIINNKRQFLKFLYFLHKTDGTIL